MARKASPWYWPERRGWYVIVNGQRHRLLDLDPEAPEPKKRGNKWIVPKEVDVAFHTLMAAPEAEPAPPPSAGLAIGEIFDKYLAWSKNHQAPRTYEWYHDHIQSFVNHAGAELVSKPVAELKPFHVLEWIYSHGDDWSPVYQRGAIIAIQRPFNWAADEMGYIDSPIKRIKKPTPQRREQFVTPEVWEKIKNHYAEGDPFRELLEAAWETGSRPQEVKRIEPRHVQLDLHRVVFPAEEAKGKRYTRVIFLTPRAEEIIKRHMDQYPEGVIFRNEDGLPWTNQAMSCRFARLKKHLDGEKFCATAFRHGFCQDMLEKTGDLAGTAALMGHRTTRMVSEVYSHMHKAESHLERLLKERANGRSR
jgi:integrase